MPLIDDETESGEEEGERRRVDRFHQGAGDGTLPLNEGRGGHCTGHTRTAFNFNVDNPQTARDDCIF